MQTAMEMKEFRSLNDNIQHFYEKKNEKSIENLFFDFSQPIFDHSRFMRDKFKLNLKFSKIDIYWKDQVVSCMNH